MKQKLRLGDCYALTKHKRKQTTIRYISLLAVLTSMCLYAVKQVSAQVAEPAATAVADIEPLQIGDTIPEWLWQLPLQVVNHPEGRDTITLAEYRGKQIILDFWATWCGSCIAAMPQLHALQERFNAEMVAIPVSRSRPADTEKTLRTHKSLNPLNLSSVVNAQSLLDYFPHRLIPHYVWISPGGEFLSASGSQELTDVHVRSALQGDDIKWQIKRDIDTDTPIFLDKELPVGTALQGYSIFFRGKISGLRGGAGSSSDRNGRYYSNLRLIEIYQLVADKVFPSLLTASCNKRLLLEPSADAVLLRDNKRFTFQYIAPAQRLDSLYPDMLRALNSFSGYCGRMEKRSVTHFQLVKIRDLKELNTSGGPKKRRVDSTSIVVKNQPIESLVYCLNKMLASDVPLVVDHTGWSSNIDLHLNIPFPNLSAVRKVLREHGLDINLVNAPVDLFVLTKNN